MSCSRAQWSFENSEVQAARGQPTTPASLPQRSAIGGTASPLNQNVNRGGVYSLNTRGVPDLAVQSGTAPYTKLTPMIEVQDPEYATPAVAQNQQGPQFPDNIAFDGSGNLWVHEDIADDTAAVPTNIHSKQYRNQQDELYAYVLNATGTAIVSNPAGLGGSGGYKRQTYGRRTRATRVRTSSRAASSARTAKHSSSTSSTGRTRPSA